MFGLEKVVVRMLEVYLGSYVESVNSEQLKLGVLKGKVELRDLRLKESALRALNLPLRVDNGVIKQVKMQVPWARLGSEPVVIVIQGVHATASVEESAKEAVKEESKGATRSDADVFKLERLDAAEVLWQQLVDGEDEDGKDVKEVREWAAPIRKSDKKKLSFRKKLLRKVLDNVCVQVHDVVLQLRVSHSGKDDFITFQVNCAQVFTAEARSMQPTFFHTPSRSKPPKDWCEEVLFRIAQLTNISVSIGSQKRYLLKPFDVKIHLASALGVASKEQLGSKLSLSCELSPVRIEVETVHVRLLEKLLSTVKQHVPTMLAHAKENLRPRTTVSASPRAWWKYVIEMIRLGVRATRPHRSKRVKYFLLDELMLRSRYINLYKRKLAVLFPAVSSMSSKRSTGKANKKLREELETIELKLPIHTCLLYRQMAFKEYENETSMEEQLNLSATTQQEDVVQSPKHDAEIDKSSTSSHKSSKNPAKWIKKSLRVFRSSRSRHSEKESGATAAGSPTNKTDSTTTKLEAPQRSFASVQQQILYEQTLEEFNFELDVAAFSTTWSRKSILDAQGFLAIRSFQVVLSEPNDEWALEFCLESFCAEYFASDIPHGSSLRIGLHQAFLSDNRGKTILDISPRTSLTPIQVSSHDDQTQEQQEEEDSMALLPPRFESKVLASFKVLHVGDAVTSQANVEMKVTGRFSSSPSPLSLQTAPFIETLDSSPSPSSPISPWPSVSQSDSMKAGDRKVSFPSTFSSSGPDEVKSSKSKKVKTAKRRGSAKLLSILQTDPDTLQFTASSVLAFTVFSFEQVADVHKRTDIRCKSMKVVVDFVLLERLLPVLIQPRKQEPLYAFAAQCARGTLHVSNAVPRRPGPVSGLISSSTKDSEGVLFRLVVGHVSLVLELLSNHVVEMSARDIFAESSSRKLLRAVSAQIRAPIQDGSSLNNQQLCVDAICIKHSVLGSETVSLLENYKVDLEFFTSSANISCVGTLAPIEISVSAETIHCLVALEQSLAYVRPQSQRRLTRSQTKREKGFVFDLQLGLPQLDVVLCHSSGAVVARLATRDADLVLRRGFVQVQLGSLTLENTCSPLAKKLLINAPHTSTCSIVWTRDVTSFSLSTEQLDLAWDHLFFQHLQNMIGEWPSLRPDCVVVTPEPREDRNLLYAGSLSSSSTTTNGSSSGLSVVAYVQIPHFTVELREEALQRSLLRFESKLAVTGQRFFLAEPRLWILVDGEEHASKCSVLKPNKPSMQSRIQVGFSDWKPHIVKFENVDYLHLHTFFKEVVDYVDYGIGQPAQQFAKFFTSRTWSKYDVENSTGSAMPTSASDEAVPLARTVFQMHFVECLMRIPASRSIKQLKPTHGHFLLSARRAQSCFSILDDGSHRILNELRGLQVHSRYLEHSGLECVEPVLQCQPHRLVTCLWTRVPFTPSEAIVRKNLYVQPLDGIRGWKNKPSGAGLRNTIHWEFGPSLLDLTLSQRQFHLFNIVLSENLADWRSPPHTCQPLGWPSGDDIGQRSPSYASSEKCFCENLPTTERVVELVYQYVFPHVRFSLCFGQESRKASFQLELTHYRFNIVEWLRLGRKIFHNADTFRIWALDMDSVSRRKALRPFLETHGESPRVVSVKSKSRDMYHRIHVDGLVVGGNPGLLRLLVFFFDGNQAERVRMGCPTRIGRSAENECRTKGVRREFLVKNIKVDFAAPKSSSKGSLTGSIKLQNTKTRMQQRILEIDVSVSQAEINGEELLTTPVEASFQETKVPDQLNTLEFQRRFLLSVDPIQLVLSQFSLVDLASLTKSWTKSVSMKGYKALRHAKRDFYGVEEHKLPKHVRSTSVLQFGGLNVLIQDRSSRRMLKSFPLVCFCSSPVILREVSEVIASAGRQILTVESDFTDMDPASPMVLKHSRVFDTIDDVWCGAKSKQGIVLSYYNMFLEKWEPAMEPFSFEWTYQKTSNFMTKEPASIAVQIQAPRPLNLNVSYQLAKVFFWARAQVRARQAAVDTGNVVMQGGRRLTLAVESPFVIQNLTGFTLLCSESTEHKQTGSQVYVKDGDRQGFAPIYLEQARERRRRGSSVSPSIRKNLDLSSSGDKQQETFALTLEWPDSATPEARWYPIRGIPIHNCGTYVYNLYPRSNAPQDMQGEVREEEEDAVHCAMMNQIAVDVSAQDGRVLVTLRSIFRFRNNCDLPIEVLLLPFIDPVTNLSSSSKAESLGVFPPGAECFLPLKALHCSLTLRPYLEGEEDVYDWWGGVPLRDIERHETNEFKFETKSYHVECEPNQTTSIESAVSSLSRGAFHASLLAREVRSANKLRQRSVYELSLVPALSVENLLPKELYVQICHDDQLNRPSPLGDFEPLEPNACESGSSCVHYLPHFSWLRFRLASSQWSAPWKVIPDKEPGGPWAEELTTVKKPSRGNSTVPEETDLVGRRFVVLKETSSAREIKLSIEVEQVCASSFVVTLFASTWIVNQVGLPLSFQLSTMKNRMASKRSSGSDLSLRIGQAVQVQNVYHAPSVSGVIFQLNEVRGTYDILFEDGSLELDVEPHRLKAFPDLQSENQEGQVDRGLVRTETIDESDVEEDPSSDGDETETETETDDNICAEEEECGDDNDDVEGDEGRERSESERLTAAGKDFWKDLENAQVDSILLASESSHMMVRFPQTNWSQEFNLESIGTKGSVQLPVIGSASGKVLELGVQVSLGPGKFRRSRVVTLMPRYVVQVMSPPSMNLASLGVTHVIVAESKDTHVGSPMRWTQIRLEVNESRPLYFLHSGPGRRVSGAGAGVMCLSLEGAADSIVEQLGGDSFSWSGAFSVAHDMDTALKVRNISSGVVFNIRLVVEVTDAASLIRIMFHSVEESLYRVVNQSSKVVHFFQHLGFAKRANFLSASKIALESATNVAAREEEEDTISSRFLVFQQIAAKHRGVVERVLSGEVKAFSWDMYNLIKQVVVLSFDNGTVEIGCEPDVLNQMVVIPKLEVALTVHFDGTTKIITIRDAAKDSFSLPTPKQDVRSPSFGSEVDQQEEKTNQRKDEGEKVFGSLLVQIAISSVTVSVIDSAPQEILLASFGELVFNFFRFPNGDKSVELVSKWVQMDNQMHQARLPVLLAPCQSESAAASSSSLHQKQKGPFLHVSIVHRHSSQSPNCMFLEYVGFSIHEFCVEVEMALVVSMWRFISESLALEKACNEFSEVFEGYPVGDEARRKIMAPLPRRSETSRITTWLKHHGLASKKPKNKTKQRKREIIYVEYLEVHPIKAVVKLQNLVDDPSEHTQSPSSLRGRGFAASSAASIHTCQELSDVLDHLMGFNPQSILQALPRTFSDVEGATVFLSALVLRSALLTPEQMTKRVGRHLSSQTLNQIYRLLGSSELLGNPIGLVTNLGSGLRDLFYEPAQGLVQSPEALGVGLARGTRSFVHRTAFGTFDSFSKLTSSIGTGFAMLSLDQRYVSERRAMMVDEAPRHVGEGVFYGAKSLGTGVSEGITGIIREPIRGAEQEGVEGFFKGLGLGIIGAAVKPAVGMLDMVSKVLAGMRNTAAMLDDTEKARRRRLPRAILSAKRTVQVFDPVTAFVEMLLVQTWGWRKVAYVGSFSYIPLPGQLLLVFGAYSLGCIDYSCFGDSSMEHPVHLWNVDVRTVLQVDLKKGEQSNSLVLSISDPTTVTYIASWQVYVRQSLGGGCQLILRGDDTYLRVIQESLKKLVVRSKSELTCQMHRDKREEGAGFTLYPVPPGQSHRLALSLIFETVGEKVGVGFVQHVEQNSPAARSGFQAGDYIVAVGGCSLPQGEFGEVLTESLDELWPSSRLDVMVFRSGKWLSFTLECP